MDTDNEINPVDIEAKAFKRLHVDTGEMHLRDKMDIRDVTKKVVAEPNILKREATIRTAETIKDVLGIQTSDPDDSVDLSTAIKSMKRRGRKDVIETLVQKGILKNDPREEKV